MDYTYCEEFADKVFFRCDNSAMYVFDNGYGAIVECNESVLCITIIKDIDGHGFNYAYPDFAHGYSVITGVETQYLIYWLTQINEIKGGHKMTKLDTLKKQAADLEAKLEESTEQLKNMKAEIDRLENGWEMKCPYEFDEKYWFLYSDGTIDYSLWFNVMVDEERFKTGNTFPTEEAAQLESKRRNLLTRFRAFRDECNGDWKPVFGKQCKTSKFLIVYSWDSIDEQYKLKSLELGSSNLFHQFGYFKNKEDAQRAIELFGDEIKRLYVEG